MKRKPTPRQLECLAHIETSQAFGLGLTRSRLAELMGVTSKRIHYYLDGLAARGLVVPTLRVRGGYGPYISSRCSRIPDGLKLRP